MRAAPQLILPAFTAILSLTVTTLSAQPPQDRGGPGAELIRQGTQLDLQGKSAQARAVFQKAIDSAPTPAAKANAQRAMAMSWAFDGDCKKTAEYEEMVIDYWKTQEKDVPGRAFYQQGEMADEAARVCLDNGDLNTARELYKKGHDLGVKEPDIPPARKDLWDYRWEHAQARIAARRGNKIEAQKHVTAAKAILGGMRQKDPKLYEQQASFLPYLTGYVALYTGDYQTALADLQKANQNDPFVQCLVGMTFEKLGDKARAMEAYRKAAAATGHNPPAAFARPFTAKKLREG
jgi:tetratricopeptide (TPR) repeat protein